MDNIPSDNLLHQSTRKPIRLENYDYSAPGYYFITICTHNRFTWFGHITDGAMCLSSAGSIAQEVWTALPDRFLGLELDQFVVMPNHMHGIFILQEEVVDKCRQKKITIADIIRVFKGGATYRIRRTAERGFAWQPRFYDSIIRNAAMLDQMRRYITTNPARWAEDQLYKQATTESIQQK